MRPQGNLGAWRKGPASPPVALRGVHRDPDLRSGRGKGAQRAEGCVLVLYLRLAGPEGWSDRQKDETYDRCDIAGCLQRIAYLPLPCLVPILHAARRESEKHFQCP